MSADLHVLADLLEKPIHAHDVSQNVVAVDEIEATIERDGEHVVVDQIRAVDSVQLSQDELLALEDWHGHHRGTELPPQPVQDRPGSRSHLEDPGPLQVEK